MHKLHWGGAKGENRWAMQRPVVAAVVVVTLGGGVLLGQDAASADGPASGTINVFAGTSTAGSSGDGGPAVNAALHGPEDVVTDASGNAYIGDDANCEVRKVSAAGIITRLAGTGTCGYTGDGGPAVNAEISDADGVAVDAQGNVYIGDTGNSVVRRVSAAGIITTFAGTGTAGFSGDHGPAASAELHDPWGVRVDRSGDVFISDPGNMRIREVNPAGIITTVAGNGSAGYAGDHGPATAAELRNPTGMGIDLSGNLLFADTGNFVIREVNAATGIITTIAGNGTQGSSGDNGPATSAQLVAPFGVANDIHGNVFIADYSAETVREVNGSTGIITTYSGTAGDMGTGNQGNGGLAAAAILGGPSQVWFDLSGNLYINEYNSDQIRKVSQTSPTGLGYFLAASDGGIFNYGDAGFYGSTGNLKLNKPIVGLARTPDAKGYWLVASDGGVFSFGDAPFYGSTGNLVLNKPIVGMAATPDGKGYWLVASDGGVFSFGDAPFYGSTGNLVLNKPIVGMAATPDGKGYWLVASDGGVFSYGDAAFYGSTGGITLNKPVVGMASSPTGHGYWLVASDGGIFNYGDALFDGSAGALALNKPVVGMAATPDGLGYWLAGSDGGIFTYGDAAFFGSTGSLRLNKPVVGLAATPDGAGYWLVASDGGIFNYGDAGFFGSTGGIPLNQPVVGMATGP
jgi:sugar lactone lactonase YvrE